MEGKPYQAYKAPIEMKPVPRGKPVSEPVNTTMSTFCIATAH